MVLGSDQLHSRLELSCEPSAARWARVHAEDVFRQWSIPDAPAGDALLIVSELVTNAVACRHVPRFQGPGR